MLDARFREGFASWRRMLAAVKGIEGRATIFENAVEEVAGYVTKGLDKVQAVDELHDMALGHGLINHWGEDGLQARIAGIFEHVENVPVVPDDWGEPQGDEAPVKNGKDGRVEPRRFEPVSTFRDPATIPRRQFLYARHYIRGAVSATIADGGIGKTNLAIGEGIAIATGRNFLGVDVPEPQHVLYWNGEESIDEIERRVHAVCMHHGVEPSELVGKFFMMSGFDVPIMIARMQQGMLVFDEACMAAIEDVIARYQIGVLTLDPFVSLHRVPEIDNTNIEAIVGRLHAVAHRCRIAVEIDHHIRKPSSNSGADASVADARGAGALINKARSARVLNRMTVAQATNAKVADHREYFRADNGKANYAPAFAATWFKVVAIDLPNGDSVGALEPWKYPGAFDAVRPEHIEKVRAMVRSNNNYRADPQSPDWIGLVIAEVVGLDAEDDQAALKKIIKTWTDNKVLFRDRRKDENRKWRVFMAADPPSEEADLLTNAESSFRAVKAGAAPAGVACVQCNGSEGEIAKFRDGRVEKGKPEVLHEGCAEAWFRGLS